MDFKIIKGNPILTTSPACNGNYLIGIFPDFEDQVIKIPTPDTHMNNCSAIPLWCFLLQYIYLFENDTLVPTIYV